IEGGRLRLRATVCALDGTSSLSANGECALGAGGAADAERAAELGRRVGDELLQKGAMRLIEQQRESAAPVQRT
ncbi:MAG: hypothetical protein ACREU3_10860, partial [Steroidobacteraceae bacterium]